MIKINLSTQKAQFDPAKLGGIDLTKVRIGPLIIAIVVIYLPDWFITPTLEESRLLQQKEVSTFQAELGGLKNQLVGLDKEKKQIEELKTQEDLLTKKLAAVKLAISEKKNPAPLLLYMAKNIPNDLWIKSLSINGETLSVQGESSSFTSVGNFISNIKSSVFIRDFNIIKQSSEQKGKVRLEVFEVRFGIARFE